MNLWIVTVNFGNTSATKSLIDSLSIVENMDLVKIGIADNASTTKSYFELEKIIDKTKLDAKIFSFKENFYYWSAAKKVIDNLKDINNYYPDWIIVCNNDIIFSDSNFFNQLKKIDAKKYPIVGPNIINSYGKKLNPFMTSPLSTLQSFYWNLYFISYPFSVILLGIKKIISFFSLINKSKNIKRVKEVYAIHGSAILLSNHFFNAGGWLDDNFEMYGEELTLAEIAKKLNLPVAYFSELNIIHYEHGSTKKMNKRDLFLKAKMSYKYFQSTYNK